MVINLDCTFESPTEGFFFAFLFFFNPGAWGPPWFG